MFRLCHSLFWCHTHRGKPVGSEPDLHVLTDGLVHGGDLLGDEAGAVRAQALIDHIYLDSLGTAPNIPGLRDNYTITEMAFFTNL